MILCNVLPVMLLNHFVELGDGSLSEDSGHYLAVGLLGDVPGKPAASLGR